ncbi:SDR family oxidoreductase [Pedobacter hartonius]|uniref:NAD(P)-dependent dehydrogenase, short-chain alcohol dehydrogenase family n=1 Tax=Pedobacter hartonius TaxID=425514 RepID=A0A1H3W2I6_9SPHI|nr:SDR family oxidoreductase [Pedobacter hartonius]SDZ81405.1 NAD(P)-dependent dehydrogenase, short-chain alcohol dehydrogenase family [Pedobacter hartonius]
MQNEQNYNNELEGKIALVTGGTKGIGKAIADKLTQAGAKVIVIARNQVEKPNSHHHFLAGDIADARDTENLVKKIVDEFGKVDILINNVGGLNSPGGGYSVLTDEHWEKDLRVNLLSAVRLDRLLLPMMIAQKSGVIIHISSASGLVPQWEANLVYGVAKSALITYSKTLSNEVTHKGVRVLAVSPGLVKTEGMEKFIESYANKAGISVEQMTQIMMDKIGGVPMGRLSEPAEIADFVSFLVSPKAAYLTGANYLIDGGNIPVS